MLYIMLLFGYSSVAGLIHQIIESWRGDEDAATFAMLWPMWLPVAALVFAVALPGIATSRAIGAARRRLSAGTVEKQAGQLSEVASDE